MRESSGDTEVGGRRIAWHAYGEGPELLLINGYAATGIDWDPRFLAALAGSRTVICPDNRGLGGSALGEDPATITAMAADMEVLLDALGARRVPVAGWSMGGFVAQALAVRAPERVSSLTLISTDPGGAAAVPAEPRVWAQLTDRSGTAREQASRLIPLLVPAPLVAGVEREFGDLIAAGREAMSSRALEAQEEAMAAWHRDGIAAPGAAGPPALVVHGSEDEVIPAVNAARLGARWRAARVELVEGAAHEVMTQAPERIAGLIVELPAGD